MRGRLRSEGDKISVACGLRRRAKELVAFHPEVCKASFGWVSDLEAADPKARNPRRRWVLLLIHQEEGVVQDDVTADLRGRAFPDNDQGPRAVIGLAEGILGAIARQGSQAPNDVSSIEESTALLLKELGHVFAAVKEVEVREDLPDDLARPVCGRGDFGSIGEGKINIGVRRPIDGSCPPQVGSNELAVERNSPDISGVLREKDVVDVPRRTRRHHRIARRDRRPEDFEGLQDLRRLSTDDSVGRTREKPHQERPQKEA